MVCQKPEETRKLCALVRLCAQLIGDDRGDRLAERRLRHSSSHSALLHKRDDEPFRPDDGAPQPKDGKNQLDGVHIWIICRRHSVDRHRSVLRRSDAKRISTHLYLLHPRVLSVLLPPVPPQHVLAGTRRWEGGRITCTASTCTSFSVSWQRLRWRGRCLLERSDNALTSTAPLCLTAFGHRFAQRASFLSFLAQNSRNERALPASGEE